MSGGAPRLIHRRRLGKPVDCPELEQLGAGLEVPGSAWGEGLQAGQTQFNGHSAECKTGVRQKRGGSGTTREKNRQGAKTRMRMGLKSNCRLRTFPSTDTGSPGSGKERLRFLRIATSWGPAFPAGGSRAPRGLRLRPELPRGFSRNWTSMLLSPCDRGTKDGSRKAFEERENQSCFGFATANRAVYVAGHAKGETLRRPGSWVRNGESRAGKNSPVRGPEPTGNRGLRVWPTGRTGILRDRRAVNRPADPRIRNLPGNGESDHRIAPVFGSGQSRERTSAASATTKLPIGVGSPARHRTGREPREG